MSASFRQLRRVIYALKRKWGQALTLCRSTNISVDTETGKATSTLTKLEVRRAIILPVTSLRTFAYDLSFIAANKNFTWGGLFDTKTRIALISRRDAPSFTFDQDMWVMFKGKRMEVKNVTEFEDEEIVAFLLTGLVDGKPLDQVDESVSDDMGLTESVGEPP